MSAVAIGAQRASRSLAPHASEDLSRSQDHRFAAAADAPRRHSRRRARSIAVLVLATLGLIAALGPWSAPATAAATGDYLLMPKSELMARPTSGAAWTALKAVADSTFSKPDLCNQNANHHLQTLAAALVFARTGVVSYGTKARAAIMAALPTQVVGCSNAVLSLGRQLTAYVLAADLSGMRLTGNASAFASWLSAIRTKNIGGHSIWTSLKYTHENSWNNWGAYAGAARIAADRYLGDTTDLVAASKVTHGFLGDHAVYAGFNKNLSSAALSWSCTGSLSTYTPVNPACTKSGINVDGAVVADISRGSSLRWPPADPGIPYQLDSIQGMGLQVELLYQAGYTTAWTWASNALDRMGAIVTRSGASGGAGWNGTLTARQMPWLLNRRYGTKIPTSPSGMGRAIGFTDWLWGP
jgi:hypothetical protein